MLNYILRPDREATINNFRNPHHGISQFLCISICDGLARVELVGENFQIFHKDGSLMRVKSRIWANSERRIFRIMSKLALFKPRGTTLPYARRFSHNSAKSVLFVIKAPLAP